MRRQARIDHSDTGDFTQELPQKQVHACIVTQKSQASPAQVHTVDLTGDYRTNIYQAARQLLSIGTAQPSDTIETYRNGKLSMTGNIGACARLVVNETRHGLRLHPWNAFPATEVRRQDAQVDLGWL